MPLLNTVRWIRHPVDFLERHRSEDWFPLKIHALDAWLTQDPHAVREIFCGSPKVFQAGRAKHSMRAFFGDHSLLLLDGEEHLRHRRLMQPAFRGQEMYGYGDTMSAFANRNLDRWPAHGKLTIGPQMEAVTLDIVLDIVFGLTEGPDLDWMRRTIKRIIGAPPYSALMVSPDGRVRLEALQRSLGPLSPYGWLLRQMARINAILRERIRHARRGDSGESLLDRMVQAKDEGGALLSDDEIVGELWTLLTAGHETSASALTCVLYRVLKHSEVRTRLLEELSGATKTEEITALPYLDAVVRESLRLHPNVPFVPRYVAEPVSILGREFRAGSVVAPCAYLVHRRADLWPEPEAFEPARFLERRVAPHEWFPFGGGTRMCIGLVFALFEIKMVLTQILRRAELELEPGYAGRMVHRGVTLTIEGGLPLRVRRVSRRDRS